MAAKREEEDRLPGGDVTSSRQRQQRGGQATAAKRETGRRGQEAARCVCMDKSIRVVWEHDLSVQLVVGPGSDGFRLGFSWASKRVVLGLAYRQVSETYPDFIYLFLKLNFADTVSWRIVVSCTGTAVE